MDTTLAKEFWGRKHRDPFGVWLTGSTLIDYQTYHDIPTVKDQVVLEIGVGEGIATHQIAEQAEKVYAVDIVVEALERVRRISTTALVEGFYQLQENSIDIAVAHFVFQHCEDDMILYLMTHTLRCLKPTGNFYFQYAFNQRTRPFLIHRKPEKMANMVHKCGGIIASSHVTDTDNPKTKWGFMRVKKET